MPKRNLNVGKNSVGFQLSKEEKNKKRREKPKKISELPLVVTKQVLGISDCVDNIPISKFIEVKSSNLKSIFFRETSKTQPGDLYVIFNNDSCYKYLKVAKFHYSGLLEANSKGQYFNKNISKSYPYKKLF